MRVVPVLLGVALSILSANVAAAQTQVVYSCSAPTTGTPCASYNWYICWPDSNTATFAVSTTDTLATITHVNTGEYVRVEGVDAWKRVGPRSVASLPWDPADTTSTSPLRHGRGHGWGLNKSAAPVAAAPAVYPNPFNPAATIAFAVDWPARVSLVIYNVAGERVRRLIDAELPAGPARAVWDGRDDLGKRVASGAYFCRMDIAGDRKVLPMLLAK